MDNTVDKAMESILEETLATLEATSKTHESLAFFSDITYTDGKPIMITGIALAEGDWNGVRYPSSQIKMAEKSLLGLPIKIEHSRTREFKDISVGKVVEVQWDELLHALKFRAQVTDLKAIELVCNGTLKSVSVSTYVDRSIDPNVEVPIANNLEFVELSLVGEPACDTCNIFRWEQLSKKVNSIIQTANVTKKESTMEEKAKPQKKLSEKQTEELLSRIKTMLAEFYWPDEENVTDPKLLPIVGEEDTVHKVKCPICGEPPKGPILDNVLQLIDHLKDQHPVEYIESFQEQFPGLSANTLRVKHSADKVWDVYDGEEKLSTFDCPVKALNYVKESLAFPPAYTKFMKGCMKDKGSMKDCMAEYKKKCKEDPEAYPELSKEIEEKALSADCGCSNAKGEIKEMSADPKPAEVKPAEVKPLEVKPVETPSVPPAPIVEPPKPVEIPKVEVPLPPPVAAPAPAPIINIHPVIEKIVEKIVEPPKPVEVPKPLEIPKPVETPTPTPPKEPTVEEKTKGLTTGELIALLYGRGKESERSKDDQ